MKRMIKTSLVYFIFAMVSGVFYRELTKFLDFSGRSSLNLIHAHLLVFGTLLFLVIALFVKNNKELIKNKFFKLFYIVYNLFFSLTVLMIFLRGVFEICNITISRGLDLCIEIVSGISHIGVVIGVILLFISLLKTSETK